jgi:ketosteroid isomerase-like protein
VLCRELAERDGRSLDMAASHVWHTADGLLSEVWVLVEDQYLMDEFWA